MLNAVVDVARHPSWVRAGLSAWGDAHWVFVSTISVYTDDATPGGRPDTTPVHEAVHTDEDLAGAPELYGAMKVGCEEAVRSTAATAPPDRSPRTSAMSDGDAISTQSPHGPEKLPNHALHWSRNCATVSEPMPQVFVRQAFAAPTNMVRDTTGSAMIGT